MSYHVSSCFIGSTTIALLRAAVSRHRRRGRRFLLGLGLAACAGEMAAQTVAGADAREADDLLKLSPFRVSAGNDSGYVARETLGGTRLKTSLRDVSSQVSVMTPEFLSDVAATSLEDAMRFSLNTENPKEYYDAGTSNNTSLTINPFSGTSRTRGLAASTTTHDLFPTFNPIDSYNTERFTFSSGPNAILFGSGNPAGSIDTTFHRAEARRTHTAVDLRADSEDGIRSSFDLNYVLVPGRAAVRVDGLKEHTEDFRKPNGNDIKRGFITTTFELTRWASLRLWYEAAQIERQPVRNTAAKDHVTPWVQAGRPLFDNSVGKPLPANSNVATAAGYSPIFLPFAGTTATSRQVYVTGQTAGTVAPAYWTNTVITRGYDSIIPGLNGFEHSLKDPAIFPLDANLTGNGLRNQFRGSTRGASLELNPWRDLYVELGANQESYRQRFVEFGDVGSTTLLVDANLYLPDRVTPNPNAGRYYVQGIYYAGDVSNWDRNLRTTVSYEFDFARLGGSWRWVGRHRLAGLLARDDNRRVTQRSQPSLVGGGNTPYYRAYVDRPDDPNSKGVYHVSFPFDLFGSTTLPGTNLQVQSAFGPKGVYSAPGGGRTLIDTQLFASQHYFLKDHVVLTYGRRVDDATGYSVNTLRDGAGNILPVVGNRDAFSYLSKKRLHTELKGVVVHPFPWLSLHYNESNSQNPSSTTTINLDGTPQPSGDGDGRDYGFTLHLRDDLVSLRVNWYKANLLDGTSTYRAGTGIGGINPFRDTVYAIEKSVLLAGAPINPAYASYENAVAANAAGTSFAGRETYDVTSDTHTKGYEVELVANPSPQWRASLGLAKTDANETNIADDWFRFIRARLPVWAAYGAAPLHTDSSRTVNDAMTGNVIASWNFIRTQEGRSNPSLRKYRANATVRYTVTSGWAKDVFVGGSYVWRSRAILGYATKLADPSTVEFTYPGLNPGQLELLDPARPYYSSALTNLDGFAGYSRRILHGRAEWRIQLNVRNVLDQRDPLAQRVDSSGVAQVLNLVDPRTWIVSTGLRF